jgi:hypothetical protein
MGSHSAWLRHIFRTRLVNRRPAAQGDWREFLQMVLMRRILPTIGSPSHLRSHLRQLDGQPSRIGTHRFRGSNGQQAAVIE